MKCPDEIAEVLLEIIRAATLNIRGAGWSGDAARCAVEADHIHNLPKLIKDYSPALLKFYWEIERPCYLSSMAGRPGNAGYGGLWQALEPLVEKELQDATL